MTLNDDITVNEVHVDAHVTYFDFQKFFQANLVRLLSLFGGLALRLEHEAWWKSVPVLTFLATVRAFPEPSKSVL